MPGVSGGNGGGPHGVGMLLYGCSPAGVSGGGGGGVACVLCGVGGCAAADAGTGIDEDVEDVCRCTVTRGLRPPSASAGGACSELYATPGPWSWCWLWLWLLLLLSMLLLLLLLLSSFVLCAATCVGTAVTVFGEGWWTASDCMCAASKRARRI